MRYTVTLICFLIGASAAKADDSETNPIAKKIKTELQKKTNRRFDSYEGYCDLMIEMEHKGKTAKIKKVKGSGDKSVCKFAKSNLKIGKRYRYKFAEKYIRLHITTGD
ncbi:MULTISPECIES: hypothetical protein [Vibrio]|uniref:hypothetical protein n=1 Tax=Vibrio TaxID=662 RepID=UPI0005AF05D1|nr:MULTISPECIES: hypothetical protein [Vibrio]KIP71439.1 hypothetical protein SN11_17030 [Vibrio harveyi]UQA51286.1 hypothetical protein ITG12_02855 [Vibrio sp. ED002]CAH1608565.1 conserved exported hypothetical protein [Vibrio jasicida]